MAPFGTPNLLLSSNGKKILYLALSKIQIMKNLTLFAGLICISIAGFSQTTEIAIVRMVEGAHKSGWNSHIYILDADGSKRSIEIEGVKNKTDEDMQALVELQNVLEEFYEKGYSIDSDVSGSTPQHAMTTYVLTK